MHLNLVMSLPLLTSSLAGFALRELSLVESKLLRLLHLAFSTELFVILMKTGLCEGMLFQFCFKGIR